MKQFIKTLGNLIQIVIKLALAVVLVFSAFTYLNKVFYNKEVYRAEDFKALPEHCLDVLVLGSSHAQYSFNPSFYYEETGLYSYVLGSSCQPFKVSYQMLKEGLKTQSPKTVILEIYTALPLRSLCEGDSCYVRAEYEMSGEEKYKTISYLPEEKAEAYRNDFLNYHNDWRTLEDWKALLPQNAFKENRDAIYDTTFGYIFNPPNWEFGNFWPPHYFINTPEIQLREEDVQALNDIYDLCQKKDIRLYLYKTPMDAMDEENYAYVKEVFAWAKEHDVEYYDFLKRAPELGYFMNLHSDSYHPYLNGSAIITHELANATTTDRYSYAHTEVEFLTEIYRQVAQGYTMRYLPYEVDPFKVLVRYQNSSGYVIIHYLASESEPLEELKRPLKALARESIDYSQNYFAIVHNGELLSSGQTGAAAEVDGHLIKVSAEGIWLDEHRPHVEGPLTLTFITDNYEQWTEHHLEYRGYTWEWGYHYYTKD